MSSSMSRRQFALNSAALSLSALAPGKLFGDTSNPQRVIVRTNDAIGTVSPLFHGQFSEHLGSCVYGGMWVGQNSSIPNINGYRKLTVQYLKELGVPVLRWPGGCFADDYHWRDGIGPVSKRPKRVNIHWGGYVEDNSFGTHEFIGFCRLIGAEPYFAGNVGSGSPEEMRNWLEYCNYPSGSSLSDERAANGSPEPFNIRLWGVGNESWGCGGQMTPEEYSDYFRRFASYLRAFPFGRSKLLTGPRPFLVGSGPNLDNTNWSRGVLERMGRYRFPDGFSMHYYENGDKTPLQFTPDSMNAQLAKFASLEQAIIQQRALIDGFERGSRMGLVVDEWGVWDRMIMHEQEQYGALWQQSTMRSAVAAGLGLNIFNRQADKLYMCNIAQMVNVLQSMLLTDGPEGVHCIRTTSYYAFLLFKPHRSNTAVQVETTDSSPLGLSVSASKSEKGLVLSLVNPRYDADASVECSLRGASASGGSAQILHDNDYNACNSFDDPDHITPKSHPVSVNGSTIQLDVPRMSVVTVTAQLS
ncbi:MAG: alpha-N-arabinofuranosidase [Terriglobia bacterium]